MDYIIGVAGSGCPTANVIHKACTVRHGPDAPSETNDVSFMVSAGGNMPVRCDVIELYSAQGAGGKFGIGQLQHMSGFATDEACINLIRSWVHTCNNDHRTATCLPEHPPLLPRRILDVGGPGTDPKSAIRLCETEEAPGSYIALSHCWGNLEEQHSCQTKKDNIAQRLNSMEWSELPKTFQDSVIITRALGIRYLWIDSLCIIQGGVEDWERESKCMARIYHDAYVTIAAAIGQSDSDGFIKEREKEFRPHEVVRGIYWRKEVNHVVHNRREPLATRAWCYQERLVPRRVLAFHHAEVMFECRLTHWCECGRNEAYGKFPDRVAHKRMLSKGTRTEEELVDYWYSTIIRDYTRLSLSYESDRLPALSAIASQIHAKTGGRCVAGIWENQVLDGLLWRCFGQAGFNKEFKWQIFLPMAIQHGQCKAPSWSWASCEGPISYGMSSKPCQSDIVYIPALSQTRHRLMYEVDVVSLQYRLPKPVSEYVISQECPLKLRGRVIDVTIRIPNRLELRANPESSHPVCSNVVTLPLDGTRHDLAIPHYKVFLGDHGPVIATCGFCPFSHETVVFWPDAQLFGEEDEKTGAKYVNKLVWPTRDVPVSAAGDFPLLCLIVYQMGNRCRGGLVLQKSRTTEGSYERLGLMEIYRPHRLYEGIDKLEVVDITIV